MHTLVCGRTRKNIKLIESATKTAIYFPPPFPRVFGYVPQGATRRSEDEVFITGETQERIQQAKQKLRELVMGVKIYVKDVMVNCNKIDNILLDRLDKVKKVMETNGSYVLFPQLGSQRGMVRVQGTEVLHVERTVREIMALVRHAHRLEGLGADLLNPGWTVLQRVLVDHGSKQFARRAAPSSF
jgi:KH domain